VSSADEEVQHALLAIHSKLNTIEGKITLLAQADKARIIDVLEEVFRSKPRLGQVYLCLDGEKTQKQIVEALKDFGVETSDMSVSRDMMLLSREYGLAERVKGGTGNTYRKDSATEDVLNLSRRIRAWLEANGQKVPPSETKRRRKGGP
jgi:hypothetical protein